jgi:hypothetical protein
MDSNTREPATPQMIEAFKQFVPAGISFFDAFDASLPEDKRLFLRRAQANGATLTITYFLDTAPTVVFGMLCPDGSTVQLVSIGLPPEAVPPAGSAAH